MGRVMTCRGCGEQYESAGHNGKWCPDCKTYYHDLLARELASEARQGKNRVAGMAQLLEAEPGDYTIGAYIIGLRESARAGVLEAGQLWRDGKGLRVWVCPAADGSQELRDVL